MTVAGIMTGTSLDGVDVALVDVRGSGRSLEVDMVAHEVFPLPPALTARLEAAMDADRSSVTLIGQLNAELARLYADCTRAAVKRAGLPEGRLQLVGSHGQTLWHAPDADPPWTLQVGCPSMLAHHLGIPVVGDFRVGDVALGGQGAPLVPYVDWCLFTHPTENRVLLNLGGIANMTWLPADAARDEVMAFDTGPANRLVDGAMQVLTDQVFDDNGRLAASGTVCEELVEKWLQHPYFDQEPPKSTGRELFSSAFLDAMLTDARERALTTAHTLATVTALTVRSVARAIARFAPTADRLLVSGGGAHNRTIMGGLVRQCPDLTVGPLSDLGFNIDAKEALCFAVLAHEAYQGTATGMPSVTGARGVAFQGKICPVPV